MKFSNINIYSIVYHMYVYIFPEPHIFFYYHALYNSVCLYYLALVYLSKLKLGQEASAC